MSQKISRKPQSARKAAAVSGAQRKVQKAKARTGTAFDRALAVMPFSEEQLHRVFLAVILGGAAVLAWTVASLAGFPALAGGQMAALAANAGFEVRRIDVRGVKNLNELKVYERVLAEREQAMPLVDIDALRAELMQLSWVKDARVSRQLPDTLVIDIVERKAHAVLRMPGRLALIDETGHVLEQVSQARAKSYLTLAGPAAAKQVGRLTALLGAAPALKPQVREAEWVGNRRWNLTFKSGQVLALPEGERKSADALVQFARLDGTNRLLGGRVAAFDMRAPDRIYFRVPGRAAQQAKDAAAKARAKARQMAQQKETQ